MTKKIGLGETSRAFLAYLDEWYAALPDMPLATLVGDTPDHVALFSIDMVNGFCKHGPLASERVGALVDPVVDLMQRTYELGVRTYLLAQDAHDPNTPEFQSYPPHCIVNTPESQAVAEIAALPFAESMTTIPKNSISPDVGTSLGEWMDEHPEITTFIVIGDCTDLCVYAAAMHLRFKANALNKEWRVVVPANAVETFDTSVNTAHELGIKAHNGDLHHVLFLHHMALNGVDVVARLA